MSETTVIYTTKELGQTARSVRKSLGLDLRTMAPSAGVGVRFLSEFERGKATAEIGKVLDVLHALGLDLAIVERVPGRHQRLSRQLGTEFPYDWSNSNMDESVFIRKILKSRRFNDILKLVAHFGFDRLSRELSFMDEAEVDEVTSILSRIQKGMLLARSVHETAA